MLNKKIRSILRKAFVTAIATALVATTAGTSITTYAGTEDVPGALVLEEADKPEEPVVKEVPEIVTEEENVEVQAKEIMEEPEKEPAKDPEAAPTDEQPKVEESKEELEEPKVDEPAPVAETPLLKVAASEIIAPKATVGAKDAGALAAPLGRPSVRVEGDIVSWDLVEGDVYYAMYKNVSGGRIIIYLSSTDSSVNLARTLEMTGGYDYGSYTFYFVILDKEEYSELSESVEFTFNYNGYTPPASDKEIISVVNAKTDEPAVLPVNGAEVVNYPFVTSDISGLAIMVSYWQKYNAEEYEWQNYYDFVYTPGKYRIRVTITMSDSIDSTQKLDKSTVLTVNGEAWDMIACDIDDSTGEVDVISYSSPEYLVGDTDPEPIPEPSEAFTLSESEITFNVSEDRTVQPSYYDVKIKNVGDQKLYYGVQDVADFIVCEWPDSNEAEPGEEKTLRISTSLHDGESSVSSASGSIIDFLFNSITDDLTITASNQYGGMVDTKKLKVNIDLSKPTIPTERKIVSDLHATSDVAYRYVNGGLTWPPAFWISDEETKDIVDIDCGAIEKLEGEEWISYTGDKFTPGIWRCKANVTISYGYWESYALSDTTELTIDGEKWTFDSLDEEEGLYAVFTSPEIVIEDDTPGPDPEPVCDFTLSDSEVTFDVSKDGTIQPSYYDVKVKNTGNQNLNLSVDDVAFYMACSWISSSEVAPGEETTLRISIAFPEDLNFTSHVLTNNLVINATDKYYSLVDSKNLKVTVNFPTPTIPIQQGYNEAYATSNMKDVVANGAELKPVYFTSDEGYEFAEALFECWKKLEDGEWTYVEDGTFTPGTWRCYAFVEIHGNYMDSHHFDEPFTFIVDGKTWTTTDYFDGVACECCSPDIIITDGTVEPDTLEFTTGDLKYELGSMKDVVIRCTGALDEFLDLRIDDAPLVKDVDYTLESGSTIATLKAASLEKLAEGNHTVTFRYTADRSASTDLKIEKASSTGGDDNGGGGNGDDNGGGNQSGDNGGNQGDDNNGGNQGGDNNGGNQGGNGGGQSGNQGGSQSGNQGSSSQGSSSGSSSAPAQTTPAQTAAPAPAAAPAQAAESAQAAPVAAVLGETRELSPAANGGAAVLGETRSASTDDPTNPLSRVIVIMIAALGIAAVGFSSKHTKKN